MSLRVKRDRHSKHHQEVDSEGTWAISYGDMVTLLLTFFVLFFSADRVQTQNKMKLEFLAKNNSGQSQTTGYDQAPALTEVSKSMAEKLIGKIYPNDNFLLIEFPGISFFKFSKIELTSKGKKTLSDFVKTYSPYINDYQVGIRAFTDSKKVKNKSSRFKDNLELSALRSVATMRYLHELGIPMNRIRVGGYGEMELSDEQIKKIITAQKEINESAVEVGKKPEKVKEQSKFDLSRTIMLLIEPLNREIK